MDSITGTLSKISLDVVVKFVPLGNKEDVQFFQNEIEALKKLNDISLNVQGLQASEMLYTEHIQSCGMIVTSYSHESYISQIPKGFIFSTSVMGAANELDFNLTSWFYLVSLYMKCWL